MMETQELIRKAIGYIKSSYTENLTIADIADHAGFCTDYFNRLFRAHTGFTVMEYVRFARLSRAAVLLRSTSRDIIDIALECGYETHESFTRAFGNLYGRSPSEYRAYYDNLPITYADVADKTNAVRFLHDHPTFRPVDNATVVDQLLHTDAIRYGIHAVVMYEYNGTQFVSDADGSYIGFDTFGNSVYADIVSNDVVKTAEYVNLLRDFSKSTSFSLPGEAENVIQTMGKYEISAQVRDHEWLYRGDVIPWPCKYTMRRLTADDISAVKTFAAEYGHDWKVCESLTQRDVFHNTPHDEPLGIYDGENLIALFRTCLYGKYGFRVAEVEGFVALKSYQNASFAREAYTLAINYLVEKGYMPFCIIAKVENFDPEQFGFDMVKTIYTVL